MIMKKCNFELIVEQLIVVLILIVHLCGFMNVATQNSSRPDQDFKDLQSPSHYAKNYNNIAIETPTNTKVVVMVIDALRIDHLVTSNEPLMKYSSSLIRRRKGLGYVLKTATPTVTMPRVKSLVTGSISSFMDVIFNFASKELLEENIIHFWKKKGHKLHFFGDETWIKLFPNDFHQNDGVTSFFVSDYTEVDNNVTRHLTEDYLNSDWNVIILHYLGLDHIGHLEGPNSHLILPKLNEMDDIIMKIHTYLKQKETSYIFLICGDHGMSDAGGHGGASHSEIHTSALVLSNLLDGEDASIFVKNSSLYREEVHHQVDIASTLALLTGIEIPDRNIGRPFMKIIKKLSAKEQLFAHYKLTRQLVRNAQNSLPAADLREIEELYSQVTLLHDNLNKFWNDPKISNDKPDVNRVLNLYEKLEMLTSTSLMDVAQSYDLKKLIFTSCLLTLICILSLCSSVIISRKKYSVVAEGWRLFSAFVLLVSLPLVLIYLELDFISSSSFFVIPPLIYGALKLKEFCHSSMSREQIEVFDVPLIQKSVIIATVFLPFTLLATSLVEEEHFTYYFTISTLYFLLFYSLLRSFIRKLYELGDDYCFDKSRYPDDYSCKESFVSSNGALFSYPTLFNLHLSLWNCFNSLWKMLFHYQLYDKAKNKSLFLQYIPNLAIMLVSSALFRFSRSFNATGDKWKFVPHLNDYIRDSEQHILQIIIIVGILISFLLFYSHGFLFVLIAIIGIIGRHYPVTENGLQSGIFEARIAYLAICSLFFVGILRVFYKYWSVSKTNEVSDVVKVDLCVRLLQYFETFVALTYLLLQKPENIFLTSLLFLHYHLILPVLVRNRLILGMTKWNVYVLALWIAQAHFFMEGNSNSLSSVQMSAGFVGITSYEPLIHGPLIALHTFGSRFLVLLHFFIVNICYEKNLKSCGHVLWTWWSVQLLTITIYVINVTCQRYHLFIWSVFAPKLLYEEVHLLSLLFLTLILRLFTKGFETKDINPS